MMDPNMMGPPGQPMPEMGGGGMGMDPQAAMRRQMMMRMLQGQGGGMPGQGGGQTASLVGAGSSAINQLLPMLMGGGMGGMPPGGGMKGPGQY